MTISSILNSAMSGLSVSQTALRATSANIANVNTPGYARAQVDISSLNLAGSGAGVEISQVRRIADSFLQHASIQAAADAAGAERAAAMLDRLQAQFGAMDDPGSLFARLDASIAPFSQLASSPTLAADRASAVHGVQQVLDEAARLSGEVRTMRAEADSRLGQDVTRANELLADILHLNGDIQRARVNGGGDATGAENTQSQLLDELAELMDIRTQAKPGGGVEVRTSDGQLLVGQSAARLEYAPADTGDFGAAYGRIMIRTSGSATPVELEPHLGGGSIASLLSLRDTELPAVAAQLGELAAGYADALNAAHNAASAVPAPNQMTGRNTGLLAGDALGFTGQTSIGVVDAGGDLAHRIDIDFDAGAISVDGGAPAGMGGGSVGDFVTALNTALGGTGGSASFVNGELRLSAGAGEGLAIQQPAANASDRAGRGFSHFFGLNDMVAASRPAFFETGMSGAEAHGFTLGQTLAFRVTGPQGVAAEISVAVGGTTINDVLSQLNNPATGLGRYASFALDAKGALVMTPAPGAEAHSVQLTGDGTRRGATGVSFSELFGVGAQARSGRPDTLSVRSDLKTDPGKLALAAPDLVGSAIGDFVLGEGDGRGALALHSALSDPRAFSRAGSLSAASTSVTDYAARLAGDIGARSARAERTRESAQMLKRTADEQRSAVEGVNLDEELANMTLYQQSYNASARLLQAAREMTDTLLNMM